MFSKIVVCSSLLAVVLSAALQEPVPILSAKSDIGPDGSFQWSYESGDGSSQQQAGQPLGGPDGGLAVQGNAQWYDPDGGLHQLTYVADDNGYQPNSADLPVAPEIPAAILKALEWNAAHPEEDGQ